MTRILSLGAGVQSSTLAMMMAHGEVEPVKCAIFADTGWEPRAVYEWLEWLTDKLPFPVHVVRTGNIRDAVTRPSKESDRYLLPSYVVKLDGDRGIGSRQCTSHYKLNPLYRMARQQCGLLPRQRCSGIVAQMVIGISYDEAHRMKDSRHIWAVNDYPLVDMRMRRSDCLGWMHAHGYPTPPKSSCIGCPFHSDAYWLRMQHDTPDEFEDACLADDCIRESGARFTQYLHASCRPLRKVVFRGTGQMHLAGLDDAFGNECEGMCGV